MSESDLVQKGSIPLHDPSAIGLQLETGRIGLYPSGTAGWMVGIRLNVDMRHYRKEGSTSGFMKLDSLELAIPALHGSYVGKIEGWDYYKTTGYFDYYKPSKCQFLPAHGDFTTFAWLDAFDEFDPWFYFGWGLRTDQLPPLGYRRWTTVAYMGVNYPIEEHFRPSWVDIPPEDELLSMVKPSAPSGQWSVKARISGFQVDPEVAQETYIVIRVWEGRRRFYKGNLDFVSSNDFIVGENDADWSGVNWGSWSHPGELTLLSGNGKGYKFRVVDQFFTGENPPAGFPSNTWCIRTDPAQIAPSGAGAKAGDEYLLTSFFDATVFKLVEYNQVFSPGICPGLDLEFPFTPIL